VKLDTQHNLLSVILLGAIGALVLIALLAFVLLGRAKVEKIEPRVEADGLLQQQLAERPELAATEEFDEIIERPVFFAGRSLPVVDLADADGAEPEPEPEPVLEIPALEAQVAGIIITPDLKLAMVKDNKTNETLVLREGMALAGEKSAWRLAQIEPREVRFATDNGREQALSLEVETGALERGAQPAPRREVAEAEPAAETEQGEDDEEAMDAARARAEEIRRRVAERRAQLRAEAERRAREQNDGGRR